MSAMYRLPRVRSSLLIWIVLMVPVHVYAQDAPGLQKNASTAQGTTAFVDVSVIPMDRERVLPHQTVLVRNGTITALGPTAQVAIPADARRIAGHGKFLMPGLADMHMHLQFYDSAGAESALLLLLANGITTIRNMDYLPQGGVWGMAKTNATSLLQLRARAAAGTLLSPRIYTSGPWAGEQSAPGLGYDKIGAGQPEDAATLIPRYKAAGFDFIKIHDEDRETLDSVAAVAHRVGMAIVGHVPEGMSFEDVRRAGYRSVEHLNEFIPSNVPDSATLVAAWGGDTAHMRALARETQQAGMWNCPTLRFIELHTLADDSEPMRQQPGLPYMTPRTFTLWAIQLPATESQYVSLTNAVRRAARQLTKALQDAGAGVLSGTDASTPYLVPGFSLHQELQALVRAGLTPYQALVTSTRNVAQYFGTLPESGTIAVGKRADLLLLDANPLLNITNTTHQTGVMIGGRWVPRTSLDAQLTKAVGTLDIWQESPLTR